MALRTKILVVDDHVLFREGLVSLFRNQPDYEVIGEAGSVAEAIAVATEQKPDLILMDFSMPDGNGAQAARAILAEKADTMIVFLTIHETDEFLIEAVRSGAKGYLLKSIPVTKLLESLRALELRKEAAISRRMMGRLLDQFARIDQTSTEQNPALMQLTPREIEVLKELSTGATNQEISERLFISVNTVKNHVYNIMHKLGVKRRRELIQFTKQRKLF